MIVTIVKVHVKDANIDAFITATELNHKGSIKEQGNYRFDVIQQEDDPSQFVLYEAFQSKDDIAKHKVTNHYLQWRKTVDTMMADTRTATIYSGIHL